MVERSNAHKAGHETVENSSKEWYQATRRRGVLAFVTLDMKVQVKLPFNVT